MTVLRKLSLFTALPLIMIAWAPATALAQVGNTFHASTSTTQDITTTRQTDRVDAFETQILGKLNGGKPLYDETFELPFDSLVVQNGVSAARLAITDAGGPGVVIGKITRTSRSVALQSTVSTTNDVVQSSTTQLSVFTKIGPATIITGDRGICATVPTSSTDPAGCDKPGTIVEVREGEVDYTSNTNTAEEILRTITKTQTYLTAETYELNGTNGEGPAEVISVGGVHAAVQSGLFDLDERFLWRMGREGDAVGAAWSGKSAADDGATSFAMSDAKAAGDAAVPHGWAEGYGLTARSSSSGDDDGSRRDAYGFAGGLTFTPTPDLVIGLGIDHGRSDLDVLDADESGDVQLTQVGGIAAFAHGPWSLKFAGVYGWGDADTRRDLMGSSDAGYDVEAGGALAAIGYTVKAGEWRLTPNAGLDYVSVRTDGFEEHGGIELQGDDDRSDRTRAFAGLDASHSVALTDGAKLELAAFVRAVGVLDGAEPALDLAFTAAPDDEMAVRGGDEGRFGADFGASLDLGLTEHASIYAGYEGRVRKDYSVNGGQVGLKVTW